MLDQLTRETFADHLGGTFRLHYGAAEPLAVELVAATALGAESGRRPGRRQPFSVVFRGPGAPVLPQRIYRFEHPALGALDLFVVPIGPDGVGMQYEAVFT